MWGLCEAVPKRARISGSKTFASLNTRPESNKEEKEEEGVGFAYQVPGRESFPRRETLRPTSPFKICAMMGSGLVGSTVFHSSHPQGRLPRQQKVFKGHLFRVINRQVH